MDVKKLGMIAASAVGLLSANMALAADGPVVVNGHYCQSGCGGKGECKGIDNPIKAANGCAGKTGCGGKGFLKGKKSEAECTKAGGKWASTTPPPAPEGKTHEHSKPAPAKGK